MICANCGESMLALELEELEIDYCDNCGGIWLDSGELELALGEDRFREDQLIPVAGEAGTAQGTRKCPICSRRMQIVKLPEGAIELDRCERGHGLWFDKGELLQVARSISIEGAEKVTTLLTGMFEQER